MKRGRTTKHSIAHGAGGREHEADKVRSKSWQKAKKKTRWVLREEMPSEGNDYEVFNSDLSGLGGNRCFAVDGTTSLKKLSEAEFKKSLLESSRDFSWNHKCISKKVLRDGVKKSPRGRKGESHAKDLSSEDFVLEEFWVKQKLQGGQSDVLRETIDLRPDHSRFIQKLCDSEMPVMAELALEEIRKKKIELFEKIYGRRVLFVGEHTDSGQHHDDLWHTGVSDDPDKSVGRRVKTPFRSRVPFRSYGVGIGASSWSRHFSALKELGMNDHEILKLAAPTVEALEQDIGRAKKQNGETPRDLKLQTELDEFAGKLLKNIDPNRYRLARSEYVDWIRQGYEQEKLGIKKSKQEVLEEKVATLQISNADLVSELGLVRERVRGFLEMIGEKALVRVMRFSHMASALVHRIAGDVGFSIIVEEINQPTIEKSKPGPTIR